MGAEERAKKEALEKKKKEFQANPQMFIDKRTLVFAAAYLPNGKVGVIVQNVPKADVYCGIMEITRRAFNAFNYMEANAGAGKPNIEVPDKPEDIIGPQS